jgi:hypothetical protein
MTTPAQTPDLESLAKQYGAVGSDQPAQVQTPQATPQATPQQAPQGDLESLAKQYGAVEGAGTETSDAHQVHLPEMVSQGHDRFGNIVRIPAKDTAGSLVGPLAIPVAAAAIGGTATGVGAVAEALPSVLIHTIEGVKALGVWAEAHPYKAFMLYQVAKELLPSAKKAMGLIKAAPEVMP